MNVNPYLMNPYNGQYVYNPQALQPQMSSVPQIQQPVQQPVQQQSTQVQTQQIQSGGFVSVQSFDEAKNYPVAPGTSVTFKDETAPYVYTKTMGFSPLDRPIYETYRLVKEEPKQEAAQEPLRAHINNQAEDLPDYALKSEYEAVRAELDAVRGDIENVKEEMNAFRKQMRKPAARKKEDDDE